MANELTIDTQAAQARAKLRSGRMRALVRDLTEAADGLDVWCQLSDELVTKQRQHASALALLRADYDAESARLAASLETARAETLAAQAEARRLKDELPQLRADVAAEQERKAALQADVADLQAGRDAILKKFREADAQLTSAR